MDKFYATSFSGLENILEKEIIKNKCKIISKTKGFIKFLGTIEQTLRLVYTSRIANKFVLILKEENVNDTDELYKVTNNIIWEKYLGLSNTFVVNSFCSKSKINHSGFMALKIKDAVADYFMSKYKKRPSVDKKDPDIYIDGGIYKNNFMLGLNLNGEPLFKRGYRLSNITAPLKETLAAGIIDLIYDENKQNFIEPMCGSGTLLIEFLMKHFNLPAGFCRKNYAFNNIKFIKPEIFKKIKTEERTKIQIKDNIKVFGYDISQENIDITLHNLKKLKFEDKVILQKQDFLNPENKMEDSTIVLNPPYGHRLKQEDINLFYKQIGDSLKHNCKNSNVYIFTQFAEHIKKIGLKTSKRLELFNGNIECRLLKYKIF